jgi:kinesin family protein 18/19
LLDHKKLHIIEEETKNYIDDLKKGTYNILVAIRCRPLNNKEKEFSDFEIVKIMDRKMVVLIDPYEYNGPNDIFKNRSREQNYAFDYAFDHTCDQVSIF